jgi:hypothetical protein
VVFVNREGMTFFVAAQPLAEFDSSYLMTGKNGKY